MPKTKEKICSQINECPKIKMILDKDMAGDWQYAQCIREVCKLCDKFQEVKIV